MLGCSGLLSGLFTKRKNINDMEELNSVLVGEKDMSVGVDQAEGSVQRSSGHEISGQKALGNASHGFGERLLKSLKPLRSLKPVVLAGMLAVPLVTPVSAQAAGLVKTTTVTYTYDDYGNATQVDTSVTDGVETFTTSVTATISNDESKWLLGRTTQVVTTSTNADQISLSRTSAVSYHGDTFLPATTTVEPGDPTLEVVKTYGYDNFGNMTSTSATGTDQVVRSVNIVYSPDGRFALSSSNALGHIASAVIDSRFGVPLSTTDTNGIVTTFEYDGFGRNIREIVADGTETVTSYNLCSDAGITCLSGAVERVLQESLETASGTAIAASSIVYVDKLGREIRSESQMADSSVIYADTVYDSYGRVIKTSAPYKAGSSSIDWALSEYDVLDRVIKSTDLNGAVTTTAHNGLSVTITTPLQETESRKNNARGELVLVTDTMGGTIAYAYDAFGNLTSTTDAKSNTVTIAYDKLGKKLNMDDPDMGYWSYGYNSYGELTSQTDAKGQTNTLTYDILGRLTQRVEAEGTTTWTYDTATNGIGLLHTATGPGGFGQPDYVETHAYDSLSRPTSTTRKIRGRDYVSAISYDTAGRLGNVTYPTGFAVDYSYTATGYLDQITKTADSSLIWKAKTRDADGRVREAQLGNGLTEWTDVDELGRVTSRRLSGAQGLQLDLAMTFDLVGNLTARQDNVQDRKETFGYDALNRLTSNLLVKTSDTTQLASTTYGYDIIGNMTLKSDLSHGGIMTYDPARPHAVATAKGGSYTYDLNGNLTGGGGRSVSWTSFNKPATIDATASLSATSFVYGPDRARIRQTIVEAGTTTEVSYVGSYYEERTPVTSAGVQSGTMEQIHYIRANEASLAIHKIEVAVDQTTTTKTRWMSLDHIGSTTVTTDELGLVEERLSYDPHGKRREGDWLEASLPIRPTFTPRGFTGHEHLDAVGIIHMNGRVYDPELGRFLSADPNIPDPLLTQDFNRYSYVGNNPLSYTDPTGFYRSGPPDDGTRGGQEPNPGFGGNDRKDSSPAQGNWTTGVAPGSEATGPNSLGIKINSWEQWGRGIVNFGRQISQGYDPNTGEYGTHSGGPFNGMGAAISGMLGAIGDAISPSTSSTQVAQGIGYNVMTGQYDSDGDGIPDDRDPDDDNDGEPDSMDMSPGTHISVGGFLTSPGALGAAAARTPPKQVKDPVTGTPVGRVVVDSKGNAMVEPVGGSVVGGGPTLKGGVRQDTHTTYPNGSTFQRLNANGHGDKNPTPHGHGHGLGTGPGRKGQGPALDIDGNQVPNNSPDAHWPAR
ncbi:RHS repeat domain-containing protein [Kiloniella majae]|uniref:RHS repeat domain-containing protein n=1 Tax=Kiloniella majae TaxID=1938558 RepID=UPI000A2785AF|nr:RHS repeat-associated core domain-containing protein [Kiloniella majae]